MAIVTEISLPALSAEDIRASFLAEAEADAETVMRVTALFTTFEQLSAQAASAHTELVRGYNEAVQRPNVKAKFAELGVPDPASLLNAGASRTKGKATGSRRGRPSRRTATRTAAAAGAGSGAEKPSTSESAGG